MITLIYQRDLNQEQRRQFRFKRRKIIRMAVISLIGILILVLGFYQFTDLIFGPQRGLDSNSPDGQWAMFRRDLDRTGSDNPSGILPQGNLKWVFSTKGAIHSSPGVFNGTVYVGSTDGNLYALDVSTGAIRWEFKTDSWVETSPAILDGVVYFGSNDGKLYALNAETGTKLWDFETKYAILSSPAVADGIVYFGADDNCVYAVDAVTGRDLWRFKTGGYAESSPAVVDGIVYFGSNDGFCYALNARNGRLRLQFKANSPVISSPVVKNGVVYNVSTEGSVYAVDARAKNWPLENKLMLYWTTLYIYGSAPQPPLPSGFLWSFNLGTKMNSSPTLANECLILGAGNKLFSIDINSHKERWVFATSDIISSSPAVAGTTIYVGSGDGHLFALDTSTGEKVWEILTGGKITSSPAIADGTLFIGSEDGKVYAIK
jgi:eukaryotic-like serine/threonine-protein kinase